jgi:hypothetical protein
LSPAFFHVKEPLKVSTPYRGDPIQELTNIRRICEDCLAEVFPAADVDCEGGKCVSIKGGSLARKVDVVPASWVHTQNYEATRTIYEAYAKRFKGINVLDKDNLTLIQNFPFLHNARIDERDKEASGNLRRLIRLVKSIRSDADDTINVSSYHIAGLCYALPLEKFSDDITAMLLSFLRFTLGEKVVQAGAGEEHRRVQCPKGNLFGTPSVTL